eukprot:Seg1012.4 transcript_id=Seg1012.4/GoldUCD/mRNA.D3Y31 product="Tyrosine-protein kinase Fer" protein_id=Seg1012.4/GoldUCD/D3Y31
MNSASAISLFVLSQQVIMIITAPSCFHGSGSCSKEVDSPILKIVTEPEYILKHGSGNISVICMVRSVSFGLPVWSSLLRAKRADENKTLEGQLCRNTLNEKPYNLTLGLTRESFGSNGSLMVHCRGDMMTRSCTQINKTITLLDKVPYSNPSNDLLTSSGYHFTKYGIIGLGVGSAAMFMVLVIGLVLLKRHVKRRAELHECAMAALTLDFQGNDNDMYLPVYPEDENKYHTYLGEEVIDIGWGLTLVIPGATKLLGSGKFGEVVLGQLKRMNNDEEEVGMVAVKKLRDIENIKHRNDFEKEVKSLAALDHPNIVKMISTYICCHRFYIIMEYLQQGTLLDLLRKGQHTLQMQHLIGYLLDIASGMEYLASKMIIHRDLAARNVLIGDDDYAKISDFGLARNIEETGHYKPINGYIPLKWVALESLKTNRFTIQSDVWSFGILMWEIFSFGKDPYEFMEYENASAFHLLDFLEGGERLRMPEGCPNEAFYVMQKCWSPIPEKRPTFTELKNWANMILGILENHQPENEAQSIENHNYLKLSS